MNNLPPCAVTLAMALGLKPLDRVLVMNKHQIRESHACHRLGYTKEPVLPYWYFQAAMSDGRLLLMSPCGYADYVDPLDIGDIIPGKTVKVHAMPAALFAERLKLPLAERQKPAAPEMYFPASILNAQRGPWGQFEYKVLFDDPLLNDAGTHRRFARIRDEDVLPLKALSRRTVMPVNWRGHGSRTADAGVAAAEATAKDQVGRFIQGCLAGRLDAIQAGLDIEVVKRKGKAAAPSPRELSPTIPAGRP